MEAAFNCHLTPSAEEAEWFGESYWCPNRSDVLVGEGEGPSEGRGHQAREERGGGQRDERRLDGCAHVPLPSNRIGGAVLRKKGGR